MTTYEIEGKRIVRVFSPDERENVAVCEDPHKALGMMLRAWRLNEDRKYTASARLMAKLDDLPGFVWSNPL